MVFLTTSLPGAFVIEPERIPDARGFFARTWCREEYEAAGLNPNVAQCSISFNPRRGTLRGLHYQVAPHQETKLVRCTMGSVYDVIVDLRPTAPTFTRHLAVVLSAQNRRMLYVPEGLAHGFQTLEDDSEVFYQMSASHSPEHARGVRWDDPAFAIDWPQSPTLISERDRAYPDFTVHA